MTRYSASERAQIAAGTFFTSGELAARPGLGRTVRLSQPAPASHPGDPNNRPVSAEARALAAANGLCAWCHEGDDGYSKVEPAGRGDFMHPECDQAWETERAAQ